MAAQSASTALLRDGDTLAPSGMIGARIGRRGSRHRFAKRLLFSIADWIGNGYCIRKSQQAMVLGGSEK